MTIARKSLQAVRLIHLALLFAAVAYVAIPLIAPPIHAPEPALPIVLAFGIVALTTLGAASFIRARLVQPASETLRSNVEDASAATRWRMGVILSLVLCETIALFGFALRFIGASWNVCAIFYTLGIFFLLAWRPRLDLPPT